MAELGNTSMSDLGGLTLKQYYRDITTDIGEQVSVAQVREDGASGIWRSLTKQRDEISGVDMNDEAAKMMVFERMFQAMAKYINTISATLDTIIELL
jgi:flagellar hook-associated protein 1 FlgK